VPIQPRRGGAPLIATLDTMIRDPATKSEIARDWAGVRKLVSSVHQSYMIPGAGFINVGRPEDSFNLPFLLAYAVLDQVLNEFIDQGEFSCKSRRLGEKMLASRSFLPWQDYSRVDAGREARNRLAHEAVLLPRANCVEFVEAVELELISWGLVERPT
jgi:hypothetical protein